MMNLLSVLLWAMTGGSTSKMPPGSHVIVKTNGGELPDRTFEEAGRLAAYYSKARGGEKVEIDYVEKNACEEAQGCQTRICSILYQLLTDH